MRIKFFLKSFLKQFGIEVIYYRANERKYLIKKHTDSVGVEVLCDPAFQESVDQVANFTLLDTARLANLWQLCRMSNPKGSIIEVGTFRGGGALHLSNSCPNRKIFICDTFESFGDLTIDPTLDRIFKRDDFKKTSFEEVSNLFKGKNRKVEILKGYFPDSDIEHKASGISFAHIDVDIYGSTKNTLEYLQDKFLSRSIIVFDDYFREADGVMRAVTEFERKYREWMTYPIYPGQGIMLHKSWFSVKEGQVNL